MKFLIMKKLYDENDAYIGAKVRFSHMYITEYDELYFIKDIKQAFKFMGIPFYVNVSTNTFRVPAEFVSMMAQLDALDEDEFSKADLKDMSSTTIDNFEKAYETIYKGIYNMEGSEERDDMMERLFNTRKNIKELTGEWDEQEIGLSQSFIGSGFVPLYKVPQGSSTTYYLARLLDDRVDMVSLEVMSFREKRVIQSVNQFYFTRKLMKTFLDYIDSQKGDEIL